VLLVAIALLLHASFGLAWAQPKGAAQPAVRTFSGMSYLDNGTLRLGVDLSLGGAITYLSAADKDENVVNCFDYGRQIQMSYYSGPTPFSVGDKRPAPHWAHLGWNPIQTGDDFHHGSRVVESRNDGQEIYVRCIPLIWPLDNVPAECTFESWITLAGNTARVRARLNNARSDTTQYPARRQELPALYTNGPYYRLMTYAGARPFTDGPLVRIEKPAGQTFPWTSWLATENWAALVNEHDRGLGVWQSGCYDFSGGFAGKPGSGGTRDSPTGYLAPGYIEIIDHNIQHEYQYVLILGSLAEIRRYAYAHARPDARPAFRFSKNRQHWSMMNATDGGWPLNGVWRVRLEQPDPQLVSPATFWHASDVPRLEITAACRLTRPLARLYFKTLDDNGLSEDKALNFPLVSDEAEHVYRVDMTAATNYRGVITGLRLDPEPAGAPGDYFTLQELRGAGDERPANKTDRTRDGGR
jgi:hypothetical protein